MDEFILYSKKELLEKFGWSEYLIFAIMLIISAGIGIYFWWIGHKNNSEFLLGGRQMGTLPMTLSLIASFISAITLLGTPSEMYVFGTQYIVLVLSFPFVMATTVYFYLPVYYHLGVNTSYEYLDWRFNKNVRILASVFFIFQMVIYMALVVYTPALAVSQVTGLHVDAACFLIFVVCIFYTSIGGIKAVMWTDSFQTMVMFGSFLAVIVKGSFDVGGFQKVFHENYMTDRIELLNFDPRMTTRTTVWALTIGGYCTWLSTYATNQAQVQRYLSVPRVEMAVKAIWWQVPGIGIITLMCGYAGLVIFAFYNIAGCDPIKSQMVDKSDQIFPLFVMQVMGDIPCIPGLFVAGVFSGALSTVSSGLNSVSAVALQDIFEGLFHWKLSEKNSMVFAKGLAIGFGIATYLIIFVIKYLPGVLEAALGVTGTFGGPILGAFTLGMFNPWANSKGTMSGMMCSLAITLWLAIGQSCARYYKTYSVPVMPTTVEGCPPEWMANITTYLPETKDSSGFHHLLVYEISYQWFSAISFVTCVLVGTVISFMTKPQDPKKLNPNLISPGLQAFCNIFPKPLKDLMGDAQIGSEFIFSSKEQNLRRRQGPKTVATNKDSSLMEMTRI